MEKFYTLCDDNHIKPSNVFSIRERTDMLTLMVKEYGLLPYISIDVIARPEYDCNGFNEKYSIEEFDVVFPSINNKDGDFDSCRNENFGEILQRKIFEVKPPITMHFTDIVQKIKQGESPESFFSKSVVDYLGKINGFERLQISIRRT